MRRLTIPVALALALTVSTSEASPSPKGPAGGKPTVTKIQTQKGGATKPSTVKAPTSKGSTPKGTSLSGSKSVKSTTTSPKLASGAQAKGSGSKSLKSAKSDTSIAKTTKAEARTARVEEKTSRKTNSLSASGTSTNGSTTTTTPGTSTRLVDFTATDVGQKLQKNSALRSKIEAKLQAAGYTGTAYEAAYGFKNLGQLNAATNQVQNQGYSFELIKVLMTGTYVDPDTHQVYRARQLADGSMQLVKPELATNPASTLSLGRAKQTITGGAVMPEIVPYTTTATSTTTGTGSVATGKSKPRKRNVITATTQSGTGSF
jgi:hypothetical protein